jgi:hypothetical protein
MKLFGYWTVLVALSISAVAAYYSIVGLVAIFASAVIPIIIMGSVRGNAYVYYKHGYLWIFI